MNHRRFNVLLAVGAVGLTLALSSSAQLAVTVLPPKVFGQKAMVPLAFTNGLAQKIESARAVAFVSDESGKVVGQTTKWVIGGSKEVPGLPAGGTNQFYFVITSEKLFTSTNLTAKVVFTKLLLDGGQSADVSKNVVITPQP